MEIIAFLIFPDDFSSVIQLIESQFFVMQLGWAFSH